MKYSIFFLALCVLPFSVFADEADSFVVTPEADSVLHESLPPVIPGETVTRGGRKMKVWSTSGSVSASAPPKPFEDRELIRDTLQNQGIIYDKRSDTEDSSMKKKSRN